MLDIMGLVPFFTSFIAVQFPPTILELLQKYGAEWRTRFPGVGTWRER